MSRAPGEVIRRTPLRLAGALLLISVAFACGKPKPGACTPGEKVSCYDGPSGTKGVGLCRSGQALCRADGTLGACEGEVLPAAELCDGQDDDCDGQVDEGVINACGGCTVLTAQVGASCGTCGVWACETEATLTCDDKPLNDCGACGADVPGLGTRCTLSGGGCGVKACDSTGLDSTCAPATVDGDGDGVFDVCDDCPGVANASQVDQDGDGSGDACDDCPLASDPDQTDRDGDGVGDACDDCPGVSNPAQKDTDGNGIGDLCDPDLDGDGVDNGSDNCPSVSNADQADTDRDGVGDVCDDCPSAADPSQADLDRDGRGDACDVCPGVSDPNQTDTDKDGLGDDCDDCPSVSNADQADTDGDGVGDACDDCPVTPNADQKDWDGDGHGDACDVVISELGPAGPGQPSCSGTGDEFVEIYNGGPSRIDLSGWHLQYRSSTGSSFTNKVIFASDAGIAAHGYLLITSDPTAGSCGWSSAVQPDVVVTTLSTGQPTTFSFSSSGGHVRIGPPPLSSSASDPLTADLLGWGTAVSPEGNPAPTPPSDDWSGGQSLERKANAKSTATSMEDGGTDATAGNNQDTNDNEADFVLRATREPQNSASPHEP